jgi:hypothetical protein
MPAFVGSEGERQALGAWLTSLNAVPANVIIEPAPSAVKAQSKDAAEEGASQK